MYAASMRGGLALLALVAFACSGEREGDGDDANPSGAGAEGGGSAVGSDTGRDGAISTGGGGNDGAGAGGGGTAGGSAGRAGGSPPIAGAGVSPPVAVAVPDLDGEVVDCIDTAPPKSFEPDLQWSFGDAEGRNNSYVMPLVANLTDDDGNGQIDLDDIPDVIVVLFGASVTDARLVALDGATGALHWISDASVRQDVTPALGDIDGDGLPEIVTLTRESEWRVGHLIAFDHEGRRQWTGDLVDQSQLTISIDEVCLALADMDADGDVEILVGNALYDHRGALLWKASVDPPFWSATAAADLDGDGLLEMVLGNAAFHHDGSEYFVRDDLLGGYPQIADFDGDGLPEIALLNGTGLHVLEHDGSSAALAETWVAGKRPPAAVLDFDGDGTPELAIAGYTMIDVVRRDGSHVWSAPVDDYSGAAAATAFDFLGDGSAEVIFGDEHTLSVFDEAGEPVYEVIRSSTTAIEYPVVADVDDDGSAEIVVVSNLNPADQSRSPAVQVFRDREDRWIKARRIWNQHTYHVTNVYEDGRIPQHERPHWELLNTVRANAASEGGELCRGVLVE
jgi:hypothetical protein